MFDNDRGEISLKCLLVSVLAQVAAKRPQLTSVLTKAIATCSRHFRARCSAEDSACRTYGWIDSIGHKPPG
jgi:TorA maturation chaperone TorD